MVVYTVGGQGSLKQHFLSFRWYHSNLTGREAETLLLGKGQEASFLVRSSVHNPGFYVLSARVEEKVSHVMIRNKDGQFDVGGGAKFPSLTELIEHYKKNPMVETSGNPTHLEWPLIICSIFLYLSLSLSLSHTHTHTHTHRHYHQPETSLQRHLLPALQH